MQLKPTFLACDAHNGVRTLHRLVETLHELGNRGIQWPSKPTSSPIIHVYDLPPRIMKQRLYQPLATADELAARCLVARARANGLAHPCYQACY